MPNLFAMSVPILKGKEKEWNNFVSELNGLRKDDFVASRKKMGVRERTFLQESPSGSVVIVTLQGKDPENAFKQFVKGNDAFTKWFLDKAQQIHGINLKTTTPEAPRMMLDTGALKEEVGTM